jgi:hypothetical protein
LRALAWRTATETNYFASDIRTLALKLAMVVATNLRARLKILIGLKKLVYI